jgi:hypothetical protein
MKKLTKLLMVSATGTLPYVSKHQRPRIHYYETPARLRPLLADGDLGIFCSVS